MSAPYKVHLLGFSPFERSALGSYFRLATRRNPAYELVELAGEAHFIVVDADHPEAVRNVTDLGRVGDAVFVGAQAPDAAVAWLMRPIDPLHVLRELDALVSTRVVPVRTPQLPRGSDVPASQRTVIQQPRPGHMPSRRASDDGFTGTLDLSLPSRGSGEALLVDDSDVALRLLSIKLQSCGLRTECVSTSGHALALFAQRSFDFVFVALELGAESELDGYGLCQQMRRDQRIVPGRRPPVLAIVSTHATEVDRVRGALAGADAYLGKPLDDSALAQLLEMHGFEPRPPSREAQLQT